MNGHGDQIESQQIAAGGKVREPDPTPEAEGYTFLGWYENSDCSEDQKWDFANDTVSGNITLYAKWDTGCLAAGTLVTMQDGSLKPIEKLKCGDMIKTFDHEKGTVSAAPVCYVFARKEFGNVFRLNFENNVSINVVEKHGFYEKESNRYVFISKKNVSEYIGHSFYNADTGTWLRLESYEILDEKMDAYSILTSKHLNTVSNGMLSISDGMIESIANVFEYDENLKIDPAQKVADIKKWGLVSLEELGGCTLEDYIDYNMMYFPIAVGKGYLSWEVVAARNAILAE